MATFKDKKKAFAMLMASENRKKDILLKTPLIYNPLYLPYYKGLHKGDILDLNIYYGKGANDKKNLLFYYETIHELLEANRLDNEMKASIKVGNTKEQDLFFKLKSFNLVSNIIYNVRAYNIIDLFQVLNKKELTNPRPRTTKEAEEDISNIKDYLNEAKIFSNDFYNILASDIAKANQELLLDINKIRDIYNFISSYAYGYLMADFSMCDLPSTSMTTLKPIQSHAFIDKGLAPINVLSFVRNNGNIKVKIKLKGIDEIEAWRKATNFLQGVLFPNTHQKGGLLRAVIDIDDYMTFYENDTKEAIKKRHQRVKANFMACIEVLANVDIKVKIKNKMITIHNIVSMDTVIDNADNIIVGISTEFMELFKLSLPHTQHMKNLYKTKNYISMGFMYYFTFQSGQHLTDITRNYNLLKLIENCEKMQIKYDRNNEPTNFPRTRAQLIQSLEELKNISYLANYKIRDKKGEYCELNTITRQNLENDMYKIEITLQKDAFNEVLAVKQNANKDKKNVR